MCYIGKNIYMSVPFKSQRNQKDTPYYVSWSDLNIYFFTNVTEQPGPISLVRRRWEMLAHAFLQIFQFNIYCVKWNTKSSFGVYSLLS